MRRKRIDKKYIYERDKGICTFCGRELLLRQISLDHYLPKSKGGPDDIFNLVLSCKKCNEYKKSRIPQDYKDKIIELFKKGVKNGKIIGAGLKLKKRELINMVNKVNKIEDFGEFTVFQSLDNRFYVKENKIFKIVYVDTKTKEDEF